ncbi:MAG: hypothetical protein ACXV4C_10485, partial [Halobacteriota archaeon]
MRHAPLHTAQGLNSLQLLQVGHSGLSHGRYVSPSHLPMQLFVPKLNDSSPERENAFTGGNKSSVLSKDEKPTIFTIKRFDLRGI